MVVDAASHSPVPMRQLSVTFPTGTSAVPDPRPPDAPRARHTGSVAFGLNTTRRWARPPVDVATSGSGLAATGTGADVDEEIGADGVGASARTAAGGAVDGARTAPP